MMQRIGFMIICLGAMCADSDWLIVPIAMVLTGAILIHFGDKESIKK